MAKYFKGAKEKLVSVYKYLTGTTCNECKNTCESAVFECKKCRLRLCDECYESHEEHIFADNDEETSSDSDDDDQQTCNICKRSGQDSFLSSFCKDCSIDMCSDCAERHQNDRNTQNHRIFKDVSSSLATEQSNHVKSKNKKVKNNKKFTPGKPKIFRIKAESIQIRWRKPREMSHNDYYQLSYKEGNSGSSSWTLRKENIKKEQMLLIGLKSKTKYTFRVRVIHKSDEWPYSKQSEVIETKESMAATLVPQSQPTKPGTPSVYALPAKEEMDARNSENKTKKYTLGKMNKRYYQRRKTIMLVGATGTGKTTLVDGIVNYVLGVNWGDPFRFTIVELEQSERNKLANQAESQTEWITCYTIADDGGRLDFTLTIVDTPGFGDTRGIAYDKKIIDQIKHIFSQQGPKGILALDAICFLNKAPDARLTPQQKYVFQQIMSMFGKDVEENICSLITFADGQEPAVLHSLREAQLPTNKGFYFNNSALFACNAPEGSPGFLSKMFWNMGHESFQNLFSHIQELNPKSLEMTRNVLHERETLENTIENIQLQVSSGLSTTASLREEIRTFKQHKTDAEANKDFVYEIDKVVQKLKPLPPGKHVTNCLQCNHTCHYPCRVRNDEGKDRCSSMNKSGHCNVCKRKCHWSEHKNTPYIIKVEIVKKKQTYSNKMKIFQKAKKGMVTHEEAIGMLKQEWMRKVQDVQEKMTIVKSCNERLAEIALRPNPLSMVEYIDIMIEAEQFEQNDGYKKRITELKFYRERATTDKKAAHFRR